MGKKYVVESDFDDLHGNADDAPDLELDLSDSENPIILAALSGEDDNWQPPKDDDEVDDKDEASKDEGDEDDLDDLEDTDSDEDEEDEDDEDDDSAEEDDEEDDDEKYSKSVQKRIDRERERCTRRIRQSRARRLK